MFDVTGDLKKARRNLVVLFYLCSLACMVPLFFTEDLKLLAGSLWREGPDQIALASGILIHFGEILRVEEIG